MLLLAFDTAANSVSVAVLDENGVLASQHIVMTRGQGEALIPMIDSVIRAAHHTMKDITDVAVSVGPGSFTGVRVGLAAARGIGLALNIPIHGVTTFEVAAYGMTRPLTVVLDSKRGDFYTQFFPMNAVPETPRIQSVAEVVASSGALVGDGTMMLPESVQSRVMTQSVIPAEAVGFIAAARLQNPLPAEPVYMREADVTV